ncbi:MAG: FAD-binding oxidoreductase [archaeon]|nr:FAD-binding oxidoreductase [archaeon]
MPPIKITTFQGKVSHIQEFKDGGKGALRIFKVQCDDIKDFSFVPGQFVMTAMEDCKNIAKSEEMKWSALSIASSHLELNEIHFCIRAKTETGLMYFMAHKMKVGDTVHMRGPYGKFVMKEDPKGIIFVATGTGIAPIISMLRTLLKQQYSHPIKLFFGFRNPDEYMYKEELESYLYKHKNFELIPTISRPEGFNWSGKTGYVQETLKNFEFKEDISGFDAYLCGLPLACDDSIKILIAKGVNGMRISKEVYD